ncbi:MAG: bifunctional serine/threonine-protein kinase/formylglycine-generating enzyme family protein, partial [Myxococcota bacterium]
MLDPRLRRRLDALRERHQLSDGVVDDLATLLDAALGTSTLATFGPAPTPEPPPPAGSPRADERYERLERLGQGGMGEVWRVRDHVLDRTLALKVLRGSAERPVDLLAEARAAARLRHPAIVTVHDVGVTPDGQLFYTMEEVEGRSLQRHVAEGPPALRRWIEALARVAQGLAFAHHAGVVHRDVKPHNIVLGSYGEVRLLDFGVGGVGTAAYLSPERVSGGPPTPASDQYALGASLHHVLAGAPPYAGSSGEVLAAVAAGPPGAPAGPDELVGITARAMARRPEDRFTSCAELAQALFAFLDGARAEERALQWVDEAAARSPGITTGRARAEALRERARAGLAALPLHAPVADKAPWWALEQEARDADRATAATEVAVLQALRQAEREAPHLDRVHQAIADHYQSEHARLERAGDPGADAALTWVRAHDRGRHAAYLRGEARLTLRTDPPGAEVTLFRWVDLGRRLSPRRVAGLGVTPLREVPVAHGSYVALVTAPGHAPVRLPVQVGRLEHVEHELVLPGPLPPSERYVPAGRCTVGAADRAQRDGMTARDVWLDGFVLRRFPVTNREYLGFLDALVQQGRTDEAWARAPGNRGSAPVALQDGRFTLVPDAEGHLWEPDWPVFSIDWTDALAYAAYEADRTGLPWRLPGELEWEKAARGVDARRYPWGDAFEDTWCNMRSSAEQPRPMPVTSYPFDRSPYGVRGLAGNTSDWCLDP